MFKKACKTAYNYYKEQWEIDGLLYAKDIGDRWLFRGGSDGIVIYGMPTLAINKESGEISFFELPNEENFCILKTAKEIELPEEYRTKGAL